MANSKSKPKQAVEGPAPSLRRTIGSVRTFDQWRTDPSAVTWLAAELASPQWQEVLAILEDNSPARSNPGVVPAEEAACMYNADQGYRNALNKLKLLAEWDGYEEPEETFTDN